MSVSGQRPHLARVTAALEAVAVHQAAIAQLHLDTAQAAVAARDNAAPPDTPDPAGQAGNSPQEAGK